jgi:hypothetical protein
MFRKKIVLLETDVILRKLYKHPTDSVVVPYINVKEMNDSHCQRWSCYEGHQFLSPMDCIYGINCNMKGCSHSKRFKHPSRQDIEQLLKHLKRLNLNDNRA